MKEVPRMTDIIVIAIVVLAVGAALGYIIREKRRGARCIGCPHAGSCHAARQEDAPGCGCGGQPHADSRHTERK